MYEGFYRLKADPFRLSADHRFCYNHRSYARAKAYVQYALYRAEGFVLVTGRPGTGKTTLVHDLLATLPDKEVVAGTLVSTQLEAEDLLLMAGHAFGLEFESPQKALVLQRLIEFFNEQHRKGLRTLLIIDEAQDLALSALEELRLLTNLQYQGVPLLQIALLGQDSLREIVRTPEMEQVHQRLVAAWQLEPLTPEETVGYVRHRLELAGWTGDPAFEPGVLEIVHKSSKGIPRRINLVCSRLLLHGYIRRLHSISVEEAGTVIEDLYREELALPDWETEGAAASGGASGTKGRTAAAAQQHDERVWEGIDRGLFGPQASSALQHARGVSAAPAPEPVQTESPITASRDSTGRHAARPPPVVPTPERRAEPPISVTAVPPVNIVPEREESYAKAPMERPVAPTLWDRIGVQPRLLPWIVALSIAWLGLLVIFLTRDSVEAPPLAVVQERLSEGAQERGVPAPSGRAFSVDAPQVAPSAEAGREGAPASMQGRDRVPATGTPAETSRSGSPMPPAAGRGAAPASPDTGASVLPGEVDVAAPPPASAILVSGRVFFRVNSTTVDASFEPLLDEVAAALLQSEGAYAEVIGYTDGLGQLDYNIALSRQRALAVASRLIQRGIAADRLLTYGEGPRDPGQEEGLSRDEERMVEITVRIRNPS